MAQVAFDTLKFVKKLELAGVPAAQAEAFSDAVQESHEAIDVATKRDLEDVRKDIELRFVKTDAEIANVHKEIAGVRKDVSQIDKRIDKLESKFDRLQWFLFVGVVGLLFKEPILRLLGV
ncbi:hypothetical protein D3C79_960830 [compost metagenome]